MTTNLTASKSYFPALTGVRAIASWMVFFVHFNPFQANTVMWRLAQQLGTGVAIFFVLSGLLICIRYVGRVEITGAWAKRYIRNRVARIYPMYILLTCLVFISIQYAPAYDVDNSWTSFVKTDKLLVIGLNLTFLRGFFDQFKFTGIAQGWTLTVEECFYFLAPFLLLGLAGRPMRLLLYGVGILATGCILVALPKPFHKFGFMDSYLFMYSLTFFGRCVEFLSGMYLALLLLKLPHYRSSNARIAKFTISGFIWIIGCIIAMAVVYVPNSQSESAEFSRMFVNNFLLVPGICMLFFGLVSERSYLRRILESQLFDLFGKSSYIFYLIHLGVLSQFLKFHVTHNVFISFLITNVLAVILYKYVEKPIHSYLTDNKKPIVVQSQSNPVRTV